MSQIYCPCIPWKQGEYQALLRLHKETRKKILPIIEIPDIGWDFELQRNTKTLIEHIENQPKRFVEKWPGLPFILDCENLLKHGTLSGGRSPLFWLMEKLYSFDQEPIPALRLNSSQELVEITKNVLKMKNNGVAIRVVLPVLPSLLAFDSLLQSLELEPAEVDLIIDYKAPTFDQNDAFYNFIKVLVANIPYSNHWRRVILIGSSFPSSMGECSKGISFWERKEWVMWKRIAEELAPRRIPVFGDYCISHPDQPQGDMRLLKPSASLRYATGNKWMILKGTSFRKDREQYRGLCRQVLSSEHYEDSFYSAGNEYIKKCEMGLVGTGNLSTWRWVGTNHHIEKVASDLSSLYVS